MTTTINHLDATRHHAGAMDDTAPPDPEVPERSAGRRQFSAKYKAKILAEYEAPPRSERGELLRREGLYSSLITTWRRQRNERATAALARPTGREKADPRDREVHTPADVHYGRAEAIRQQRGVVLLNAYGNHPERFVRQIPSPPALPVAAWINKPEEEVPTH
jgi:transposase-like protein